MQELEHLGPADELFVERLEAFMQKCLLEVRAFSEREHRSYEETVRRVAEWHTNYLLERSHRNLVSDAQLVRVRPVLLEVSQTLESLHRLTGVHSFFLAVNPRDSSDQGFLGGTTVGRDFWRRLRGGGDAGANHFKSHCLKAGPDAACAYTPPAAPQAPPLVAGPSTTQKSSPAHALKNELYNAIRSRLRTTSGVRNAEMKWSNHERLSAYGVRMVGWPEDIPKKNPSVLNSTQNKQLLELAQTGVLGFSRLDGRSVTSSMGEGLWNNPVDDASSPRNAEKSWTNHERRLGAYDDSLSVASSMHAEDLVDKTSEEDAQTLDFMNEYICSDGDYAAGSLGDSTISYSMSSRSPDDSGDGGVASAAEGDGDLGSRKRPRYGG
ncbi:hypothetical protein PTI98_009869 [Pleurotus ostreatus]|nr:hypothetical protein PTI98_009869 [Pleurotus ostreatus]